MNEWVVREHPDFFSDLDRLDKMILEIFYKKKKKIKDNPEREKHLVGADNCYRVPITKNVRLVYYIEGKTIWLLTIGKHKEAYKDYLKRLYYIKNKLKN